MTLVVKVTIFIKSELKNKVEYPKNDEDGLSNHFILLGVRNTAFLKHDKLDSKMPYLICCLEKCPTKISERKSISIRQPAFWPQFQNFFGNSWQTFKLKYLNSRSVRIKEHFNVPRHLPFFHSSTRNRLPCKLNSWLKTAPKSGPDRFTANFKIIRGKRSQGARKKAKFVCVL